MVLVVPYHCHAMCLFYLLSIHYAPCSLSGRDGTSSNSTRHHLLGISDSFPLILLPNEHNGVRGGTRRRRIDRSPDLLCLGIMLLEHFLSVLFSFTGQYAAQMRDMITSKVSWFVLV
uniref:Secreted protein n=1 Tax=Anopheles darlingi TaxID=43151 RepID=A0A2M4D9T8_ANODA